MSQTPLDKLKNLDWRGLVKTATNKVKQYTLNLSPLEIIVEDATNKETWGPHGSVMGGRYRNLHTIIKSDHALPLILGSEDALLPIIS